MRPLPRLGKGGQSVAILAQESIRQQGLSLLT